MALVRNEAVLTVSDDWQSVQRVVSLGTPKSRIITRIRYSVKLGRKAAIALLGRCEDTGATPADFYVSLPARSTFLRRFVTVP
jgi:hypothetical protein